MCFLIAKIWFTGLFPPLIYTTFTWLKNISWIVTTLHQYYNGFWSYGYKHCFQVSSSDRVWIVATSIFHTKVISLNTITFNHVNIASCMINLLMISELIELALVTKCFLCTLIIVVPYSRIFPQVQIFPNFMNGLTTQEILFWDAV